jgi:diacylglycerol kinase family enzyme
MAGGDGSQALVASVAVEEELPFVCISAGTRNHFALDLGLDREDPRAGMMAFRDAVERRVDYATVNDRLFVNNVSLGVYATIVQSEDYRDNKVEVTTSSLSDMLGSQAEPFDLQYATPKGKPIDGAFLIMVSNNPYVLGAKRDIAQRRRMDSGNLGVFAVSTRTGAHAARLVTLAALGVHHVSPHFYEFTADRFVVNSRSGTAYMGVDGEALEADTPLHFEIHPAGLRMFVPRGNLAIAEQRRARTIRLGDVGQVAMGREPEAPVPTGSVT